MLEPSKRAATYEDLRRVPDNLVAELVSGELYANPRPASPHAKAATGITASVYPFDGDPSGGHPGGWWILAEPELHLHGDVVVPDIAGWRRNRMPEFPDVAAFELAPDWVCEVVSPRTAGLDRVKKMALYAREHVQHAWIVDPVARTLEVFGLEGGRWVVASTHEGAGKVRAEPFDAELDAGRWWMPAAT